MPVEKIIERTRKGNLKFLPVLVGMKSNGGTNFIVMVSAESNSPQELERVPLVQTMVFLKADCDFKERADKARFAFSLDGKSWTPIGGTLKMTYCSHTSWATTSASSTTRQRRPAARPTLIFSASPIKSTATNKSQP